MEPLPVVKLTAAASASPELVAFFESVYWGTGKTTYRAGALQQKLEAIPHPLFLSVSGEGKMMAALIFSEREIAQIPPYTKALYIRYLAVSPALRGKAGIKTFYRHIQDFLAEKKRAGYLLYACIEAGNSISRRIAAKLEFHEAAQISLLGFSRFFPRRFRKVRQLTGGEEKKAMLESLATQYAGYRMVQFNKLKREETAVPYYAVYENGRPVAGAQVAKGHWQISTLDAGRYSALLKWLPRLPFFRKYFNPQKFRFIAFEAVYMEPGAEQSLFRLFEHLLRLYKVRAALCWFDGRSPLYSRLTGSGKTGFLHALVKNSGSILYTGAAIPGPQPFYVASTDLL